jgi:hypothetical protein
LHSLTVIAAFFMMLLAPCAFAIFSSREKEEPRMSGTGAGRRRTQSSSWRATTAAPAAEYDLILPTDPEARGPALTIPQSVYSSSAITQRPRSRSSNLANLASDAEAQAIAAQIRAAQANKDALEAIARAASARAAAATALAAEAQRAVAEASRVADAVRRAYETAPASVGPTQHALPETHPSMDFPRSHVIRRAA